MHAQSKPLFMCPASRAHEFMHTPLPVIAITTRGRVQTPAWRRCALHAATARCRPLPRRPVFPAAAAAGLAGAPPAAPSAVARRGPCGHVIGPLAGAAGPPRRPRWRRRRLPRGVGGNAAAAACHAGGTSDSGQRRDGRRGRYVPRRSVESAAGDGGAPRGCLPPRRGVARGSWRRADSPSRRVAGGRRANGGWCGRADGGSGGRARPSVARVGPPARLNGYEKGPGPENNSRPPPSSAPRHCQRAQVRRFVRARASHTHTSSGRCSSRRLLSPSRPQSPAAPGQPNRRPTPPAAVDHCGLQFRHRRRCRRRGRGRGPLWRQHRVARRHRRHRRHRQVSGRQGEGHGDGHRRLYE